MSDITWYCFARVLPKIGYQEVSDRKDSFVCYKDNEPLLVLRKEHRYHPLTVTELLKRVQISSEQLMGLLKQCNSVSQ